MKISITDRLPEYTDFVWVWRTSTKEPELAYFIQYGEISAHQFQSARTAGDAEGLSVEYFYDVTHWAELELPKDNTKGDIT